MYMAAQQQGQGRGFHNNLQNDNAYDEPLDNRYVLRPNNRVQEIDEEVLKESGATDDQINAYKASVNTTNDEKLAAAGIDPVKVTNISRARYEGTFQGGRNLVPQGEYSNHPEFLKSWKIANAKWIKQAPHERIPFFNTGNKYEYVSGNPETPMYKAGLAHRAQNKAYRQATQEQRDNKEFRRGYKALVADIDMDAGVPDRSGAAGAPIPGSAEKTTRSTGSGTPTLANKLPSPQKPVGNLIDTFEAYARGLGKP